MDTISDYMQQDHALIDGIGERAGAAAAAGDGDGVAREGARFLERLGRHIEMEEQVLFPAFEQCTGMTAAGPSVQMRIEHDQMRLVFESMHAAIDARDAAAWQQASQALLAILLPHNMKEERVMYPMIEQAVGADAAPLLARIKAMAG